jgi:hypothetical protein
LDDADGVLVAQGDATFGGQGSDLRAGQLHLYGDWQVTAPMTSGATVYLDGSSEQTISFSDPGPGGGQHNVAQMWVYNSGGMVTFATNAFVTGNLYAYSTTLAGPGTTQLQVGGSVTLDLVTFDGLPLRIVSNTQPNASYLNQITFTGMLPGVSQLYVDLPGVTGVPLVLDGPTFATVPTGGGYYLEAVNPVAGGATLYIQLNNPLPATSGGYTKTAGNVQIVW